MGRAAHGRLVLLARQQLAAVAGQRATTTSRPRVTGKKFPSDLRPTNTGDPMAKAKSAKAKPKEKAPPTKKVRVRQQVAKGPHGGVRVVLAEDVTHVGKQGQVVEVKP